MHTHTKRITAVLAAAFAVGVAPAAAAEPATFYDDPAAFEAAVDARGLAVDAAEDFEDARPSRGPLGLPILGGPATGAFAGPLDAMTDNQFFAPGQIPAALRVAAGDGATQLAVSRPSSVGEHGSPTTISSPFTEAGPVSLDVESVDAAHEAVALDASLVEFSFVEPGTDPVGGPLTLEAFDEAGASLGTQTIDQEDIGPFVGILAPEGTELGRVNLSEPGGSELLHAVVAYDADGGEDMGTAPPAGDPLAELLEALGLG